MNGASADTIKLTNAADCYGRNPLYIMKKFHSRWAGVMFMVLICLICTCTKLQLFDIQIISCQHLIPTPIQSSLLKPASFHTLFSAISGLGLCISLLCFLFGMSNNFVILFCQTVIFVVIAPPYQAIIIVLFLIATMPPQYSSFWNKFLESSRYDKKN